MLGAEDNKGLISTAQHLPVEEVTYSVHSRAKDEFRGWGLYA
jgi:hypothetical protein